MNLKQGDQNMNQKKEDKIILSKYDKQFESNLLKLKEIYDINKLSNINKNYYKLFNYLSFNDSLKELKKNKYEYEEDDDFYKRLIVFIQNILEENNCRIGYLLYDTYIDKILDLTKNYSLNSFTFKYNDEYWNQKYNDIYFGIYPNEFFNLLKTYDTKYNTIYYLEDIYKTVMKYIDGLNEYDLSYRAWKKILKNEFIPFKTLDIFDNGLKEIKRLYNAVTDDIETFNINIENNYIDKNMIEYIINYTKKAIINNNESYLIDLINKTICFNPFEDSQISFDTEMAKIYNNLLIILNPNNIF